MNKVKSVTDNDQRQLVSQLGFLKWKYNIKGNNYIKISKNCCKQHDSDQSITDVTKPCHILICLIK